MKPPPPRLPAEGQVTASASPTATAASTALPPFFITSTPTREAISEVEATIPLSRAHRLSRRRQQGSGDEQEEGKSPFHVAGMLPTRGPIASVASQA